ncbi:glycoside hydrolase family 38 N-terminal domain-containing protein [Saccharothrix deserti]|uniref:glycoside hydrolase family 38 N-terminal domain-containing protein n=1 Tax=Saccharothrix deserti TaxID=2593674 RepID=UPI00131D60BF|nr:glycoside hydrolase family 38 C-terminal domain-containing protein [Saccharothrix deserti]
MRITSVQDTDLFVGSTSAPRQLVRVGIAGPRSGPARVRVVGPMVRTPEPAAVAAGADDVVVEVGVTFAAPTSEGVSYPATVLVEPVAGGAAASHDTAVTVAETGWTMWMISHFHYDPVWWNTQAGFTETWLDLPGAQEKRMPFQLSAFDLVRAHLDAARRDPDYRFVLAEVDYLKPHWDAFPEDRHDLRRFLRDGQVEIVGGNYNEANTNLTHPESTIRNAVYGIGYQRDVLGAEPRTAWMLDVFGHDPSYPGLMADAGLDSSAWARGPWHHVGAKRHTGDITRMQFPSEFEWISPSGRGVLTAYMADHYVAGWDIERKATLDEAMAEAYRQFSSLRRVAATRNVMLPVGHDHNVPSRFCTEIHREWNARYVWPRFVVGLPRDFFAAVRADAADRSVVFSPQTRDMNPVYTGKDVSYIDTKQAQRAAEVSVLDGERMSVLAALLGARYPAEALDKAWRQLVYGAHHDAITGTESDQVYLDLVNGWREADELGREVLDGAVDHLAQHVDTTGVGEAVIAVNTLAFVRDAVTSVTVRHPVPGRRGARVEDPDGLPVPAVTEAVVRHPDGTLASLTLSFLARQVPATGYRVYRVVDADTIPPSWTVRPGRPAISNESFTVEADPARGGALTSVHDRRAGRELVRPGGLAGELVVQDEHPGHPVWGEGPWHLLPTGPGQGVDSAQVHVETSPVGERIVSRTALGGLRITQHTTLWHGLPRVDVRAFVDGSVGQDRLLRARFAFDVPGALPVAEVGFAAVGRSFGFPDVDAAEHLWTLDSPAHTWAGLSSMVRLRLRHSDGQVEQHAIGVAELVTAEDGRAVMAALAAKGVTATCTGPRGPRYGALDADSNLPDVRIVLGDDQFAAEVLDSAGAGYREALAANGRVFVPASRTRLEQWVPDADLRGPRDLPVLIVTDADDLISDLGDGCVEVDVPAGLAGTSEPLVDYSVAVVNRGTPGFVVAPDGTLHVSLMRSCSGWPSGVWIDGERRTAPDGSSFAWQHWSHTFELSLVAGNGDWRRAGFARSGQDVNHPVRTRQVSSGPGPLPRELGLMSVSPPDVLLTAAKAAGNPLASCVPADTGSDITVRLYETTGTPVTAVVSLYGGLVAAHRADLLEERTLLPLTVESGQASVDLTAADVATLNLVPALARPRTGVELARSTEPVQPVYTRYWRHNAGPAPIGNLPLSVHVNPSRLRLDPGATGQVRITVSCTGFPASGLVEFADREPLSYDLVAGEFAEFTVPIVAPETAGRHLLAARVRDHLGQVLEDTTEVVVGPPSDVDLVDVRLEGDVLELVPGGRSSLAVSLANRAQSEVRGEVTLISPYGTWGDEVTIGPRTQAFTVPPDGEITVPVVATAAGTARPGSHWWALVRVAAHGRLHYTPAVRVTVR